MSQYWHNVYCIHFQPEGVTLHTMTGLMSQMKEILVKDYGKHWRVTAASWLHLDPTECTSSLLRFKWTHRLSQNLFDYRCHVNLFTHIEPLLPGGFASLQRVPFGTSRYQNRKSITSLSPYSPISLTPLLPGSRRRTQTRTHNTHIFSKSTWWTHTHTL